MKMIGFYWKSLISSVVYRSKKFSASFKNFKFYVPAPFFVLARSFAFALPYIYCDSQFAHSFSTNCWAFFHKSLLIFMIIIDTRDISLGFWFAFYSNKFHCQFYEKIDGRGKPLEYFDDLFPFQTMCPLLGSLHSGRDGSYSSWTKSSSEPFCDPGLEDCRKWTLYSDEGVADFETGEEG